jgi:hypothetical protein
VPDRSGPPASVRRRKRPGVRGGSQPYSGNSSGSVTQPAVSTSRVWRCRASKPKGRSKAALILVVTYRRSGRPPATAPNAVTAAALNPSAPNFAMVFCSADPMASGDGPGRLSANQRHRSVPYTGERQRVHGFLLRPAGRRGSRASGPRPHDPGDPRMTCAHLRSAARYGSGRTRATGPRPCDSSERPGAAGTVGKSARPRTQRPLKAVNSRGGGTGRARRKATARRGNAWVR